jgi:hypothetical protein
MSAGWSKITTIQSGNYKETRLTTITHPGLIADSERADIASQVEAGAVAIVSAITAEPDRTWSPSELIDVARQATGALTNTVPRITFWKLVDSGVLSVDEDLTVSHR